MAESLVVVIGIGSVGSQLANELAINGVGHLRLFDGKPLEEYHLARHALTKGYVGQNKATGMKLYFSQEVPTMTVDAHPRQIDSSMADDVIDGLLQDAALIIAATDDREVQRVLGRRALALDIPAVFPGLYEHDGGEVFVQRSPRWPCFFCRDGFRPTDETLRGVSATNPDILGIIALASRLSLGVLDLSSDYLRRLMRPSAGERVPPQLFVDNGLGLARLTVPWRKDCPSCAVGPSPMRKEAAEAWRRAESQRETVTVSRASPTRPVTRPQLQRLPFVGSPATPQALPAVARSTSASANHQRRVNRVLFAVCAVIVAALVIAMASDPPSKPAADISAPVRIDVDYSQALPRMIEAAHLRTDENDVPITETQFPVTSGPAEVAAVLIRLTFKTNGSKAASVREPANYQTAYEIEDDLSQLGYRPATLPELLALIAQYPRMRTTPIVELAGTVYDDQYVTCEASKGYLRCVTEGFDQAAEFLAVPK
jgi:molybdopterin/thiamine biosynthesis adenylyltransferase